MCHSGGEQGGLRRAEDECLKEEEKREQEKKKPKIGDFDENRMVLDHIIPRPSQFAIGKLKSFNFIELWYSRLPHNPYLSVDQPGYGLSGSMGSEERAEISLKN